MKLSPRGASSLLLGLASKEASLLAQFAICKSVLGKPETPTGNRQRKGISK